MTLTVLRILGLQYNCSTVFVDRTSLAPYTDKYFIRSVEILQKEDLNPYVRAQIFLRKGPGKICGIKESVSLIKKIYGSKVQVFSLQEGDKYDVKEVIMVLESKAQDVIMLETVILGIISAATTKANDNTSPQIKEITKKVKEIVRIVAGRPVIYFGARHWRYDLDEVIAQAAFAGGASDASTDAGAAKMGKEGVGTIPHALECIYAWKYGLKNAVVESTKAFDRHIDHSVPRVALVDFANREIDDALAVIRALGSRLTGIRIDTCWENAMQGSSGVLSEFADKKYWHSGGVTIAGVYKLKKIMIESGHSDVKVILSSGFGNIEKVTAFVKAEKVLGLRLFDTLGVGQLFPVRAATMDIVGVGETLETMIPIAKVGRHEKKNKRLQRVL